MRTLLFVQTGDARPKVGGEYTYRAAQRYAGDSEMWMRVTALGKWMADRWWLVECEDADAGRAIITHDALLHTSIGKAVEAVGPVVKSRDPNRVSEPVQGRILASGGRP